MKLGINKILNDIKNIDCDETIFHSDTDNKVSLNITPTKDIAKSRVEQGFQQPCFAKFNGRQVGSIGMHTVCRRPTDCAIFNGVWISGCK